MSDDVKANISEIPEREIKYGYGVRHIQVILFFICLLTGYIMRVNMSVAIIAMIDESNADKNIQVFYWEKKIQDVVLSSFYWGYTIMQIPGGYVAQRYGAKILIVLAMIINGLITLTIPWAAAIGGWKVVCAMRTIQGLTQSPMFPSIHTLISKWIPNSERSRLGNFVLVGTPVGTIVGMPLSSLLASTSLGWPCIFYVIGALGIIVGIVLYFFSADSPAKHSTITKEEKSYIEDAVGAEGEVLKTPWRPLLTSIPLLAIMLAHIGCNWGFVILLMEIPSYLKQALGIDVKTSGFLSALPYLAMWIGSMLLSFLSDYLVNKKILTIGASRKLFNTIGTWLPGIGLIILGYIPKGCEVAAVTAIVIIVGLSSGMNMGFMMNYIDLSPNFAGTMVGITNCIANGLGILAPITVGLILKDETDINEWRLAFLITAAIYFITNLFFMIFGSGEKQPWNEPDYKDNLKRNCDINKTKEELERMINNGKA